MKFHPFNLNFLKFNNQTEKPEILSGLKEKMLNEFNSEITKSSDGENQYISISKKNILNDNIKLLINFEVENGLNVFHGDIFYNKYLKEYFIFSFIVDNDYNIINHVFYFLERKKNKNKYDLIMKDTFVSISEFILNYLDYSYVANVFIQENEQINKSLHHNEISINRNNSIKISHLKRNQKFIKSCSLKLSYFSNEKNLNLDVYYEPFLFNTMMIDLLENDWEINVSFNSPFIQEFSRIVVKNEYRSFSTGFHYTLSLDNYYYNYLNEILQNPTRDNYKNLENVKKTSLIDYDSFIAEYTHEGLIINSFNKTNVNRFFYKENGFIASVRGSFLINYDKESNDYLNKYLLLI